MGVKTGITAETPDRIFIDAGAVYLNYGLVNERLLGATRGGNEFNLNRVVKNIEVDGLKGAVKGMKRVTEVNPQITANLIELTVENLIAAIAGASQSDRAEIKLEYAGVGDGATVEFDLNQNDVVKNSEKVYLTDAAGVLTLQSRSKKYSSRFVGANATDNKEFEEGLGNWAKGHADDIIARVTGGYSGNCLKFTGTAASVVGFLTLDGASGAVLTDLVVGEHYRFQIAGKRDASWGGGVVTVACDAGSKAITLAETWKTYVIEFIATGTSATITLTAASAPTAGSCFIDFLELERVDGGYVMNWGDNVNGKALVIFPEGSEPTSNNNIIVSYTYELAAPGDHTVITGGEISDSDYIDNIAIVGNISGKTKAVICMVKNALADAGFSLSTAPRDEAVPVIIFTGHYAPDDLDTEPWEVRYPNA